MGSIEVAASRELHAVCIPYPAQGHVKPMMLLAKLLLSKGFHITFVNTEFNHQRLIRLEGSESLKGVEGFQFETIPDGLPPSDEDATQDIPALCDSTSRTCVRPFKELLVKLNSSGEVPEVTIVVTDGIMGFGRDAAKELGILEVQFWTASCCSFIGDLHYSEVVKRGIVPFKDESYLYDGTLDMPIDWIPSMPNIRIKDMPSFVRTTDANDIMFNFIGTEAPNCLKSTAIIFNTFDQLEHEVLESLSAMSSSIYSIGPLTLLGKQVIDRSKSVKSLDSNFWKEDTKCLDWLDKQEPGSVIYVNYGSITSMTDQHLKEFAWGLANSKHPFLWILRQDVIKGGSLALPDGFLEEIKDKGYIAGWCPQGKVLAHPSAGVFLTHCGWNSTIETISEGVPVICWPFFSDQQTNCYFACTDWEIGMEVNNNVKRDEIEELVMEMLEGEKGLSMRSKAKQWKK